MMSRRSHLVHISQQHEERAMFTPNTFNAVEVHMYDRQEEARRQRLVNQATVRTSKRRMTARVMTALGHRLVAAGRYLVTRSEPRATEWEYMGRLAS
jgi:hypothetical protein